MKRFLIATAIAIATVITPALAADDGILLNIGQPGFYNRLNICDYPQPRVNYRQPRLIENVPMNRPLVYLGIPLYSVKHGGRYSTCGNRDSFAHTIVATTNTFRVNNNSLAIAGTTALARAQG